MPGYISPMFKYHGRHPSQFDEPELLALLCPQARQGEPALKQPLGYGTDISLKNDKSGNAIAFTLKKSEDGKTITLDSTLKREGTTYKTSMVAKLVKDDLYQITQLTFDNHVEKLSHRWEITKVLAHIGEKQLKKAAQGVIPLAHEERGKFGKFSRFLDRCMPDDPSIMMPPPF